MKLSTSYLRECAKANDWLQFIVHSQLHNYYPEEVSHQLLPVIQEEEIGTLLRRQYSFCCVYIGFYLIWYYYFLLRFQWVDVKGLVITTKSWWKSFCDSRLNMGNSLKSNKKLYKIIWSPLTWFSLRKNNFACAFLQYIQLQLKLEVGCLFWSLII